MADTWEYRLLTRFMNKSRNAMPAFCEIITEMEVILLIQSNAILIPNCTTVCIGGLFIPWMMYVVLVPSPQKGYVRTEKDADKSNKACQSTQSSFYKEEDFSAWERWCGGRWLKSMKSWMTKKTEIGIDCSLFLPRWSRVYSMKLPWHWYETNLRRVVLNEVGRVDLWNSLPLCMQV